MASVPFSDFQHCLCFNVRRATRAITQHYDDALAGSGLRVTQLPILARLAAGPMTMSDLAAWLGRDRTTLVRNLRPLEEANYIASAPRARGRQHELSLTEAGAALLKKAYPLWKEAQTSLTRSLGDARWAALIDDLTTAGETISTGRN